MSYKPPYVLTPIIIDYISRISEELGKISILNEIQSLRLRKINRIKTIQGSLAIEGNTLTENQIQTILEGKTVVAPLREIQEVKNAIRAYDEYQKWNPLEGKDLLTAHAILTMGLIDKPGAYRKKSVGVMGGKEVIHIAPPFNRIPVLMRDLFSWLSSSKEHPLVSSSVFHYEFEFIHPFEDGNGRMGRLWQNLILSRWNPLFTDIPVENMIFRRQQDYYNAIARSSSKGECTTFIEFMLETILLEISEILEQEKKENLKENTKENLKEKVLEEIKQNNSITAKQLAEFFGLSRGSIDHHLGVLKSENKIIRRGATKKGYWEVVEKNQ